MLDVQPPFCHAPFTHFYQPSQMTQLIQYLNTCSLHWYMHFDAVEDAPTFKHNRKLKIEKVIGMGKLD